MNKGLENWGEFNYEGIGEDGVPKYRFTPPGSPMHPGAKLLLKDIETLDRKASDYAPDNWARNFEYVARAMTNFTGRPWKPSEVAMTLFFVKVSRMESLGMRSAANEKMDDTLGDARNYLAIAQALMERESGKTKT